MGQTESNPMELKSTAELAIMRRAGRLLAGVMREVSSAVEPGITTLELDRIAFSRIKAANARPAFLNLYGFPNTLCISVNEEVVHGIPKARRLVEGDIVSIDCGLVLDGFFSDMAMTLPVGQVNGEAARLINVTREALAVGIAAGGVDKRVGAIGAAIEKFVHGHGFKLVEDYAGHGIGRKLHEEPQVFNTSREIGRRIPSGLVLAIEPMVNVGTSATEELSDGWTVVTKDRSLSAHFEHTVAFTRQGAEILTLEEGA